MSEISVGSTQSVAMPDRETSVAEIVRALESDILFGALRPRERLIEDALMERFGAKRHAVRQALAELDRLGIVTRTPHRGASVHDFTAEEVEEITELREILHRRAVKRMRLPVKASLVKELESIQRRHDKAVVARDLQVIDDANVAFHAVLFAACGNRLLARAIGHYMYLSRAMRLYPLVDPNLLETSREEHWAIIQALKDGDRRKLGRLVVEHIQHSKRLYLRLRGSLGA